MEKSVYLEIVRIMKELSIDNMYLFFKSEVEESTEQSYLFVSSIIKIFAQDDSVDNNLILLMRDLIFNRESIPIDADNYNISSRRTKNYKYIPALLTLCEFRKDNEHKNKIDIYTTGSWGESIRAASNDLWGDDKTFNIINVSQSPYATRFELLRKNSINTDSIGSIIGTIMICLCMPSSSELNSNGRRILPLITQGNLLKVLISMGYCIGDDIRMTTSI